MLNMMPLLTRMSEVCMYINGQGLCYTINWDSKLSHGVLL